MNTKLTGISASTASILKLSLSLIFDFRINALIIWMFEMLMLMVSYRQTELFGRTLR